MLDAIYLSYIKNLFSTKYTFFFLKKINLLYYFYAYFDHLVHFNFFIVLLLQKESWIFITDNTNVKWIKVFHLYKGSFRKSTKEGLFIKGSARVVEPPRVEYKGFKYKFRLKGDICRSWIVRTKTNKINKNGKHIKLNNNSSININKKSNVLSKYLNGPIIKLIGIKKLLILFPIII